METLGTRIRRLRLSRNITQLELAKRLGLKPPSLSAWERDESKPSGENLIAVSYALKVAPEEILGYKPNTSASTSTHTLPIIRSIPILTAAQAASWRETNDDLKSTSTEILQETTARVGNTAFALKAQGKSMQNPSGTPSIPDGSMVIVDPGLLPAQHGNIVVAKLNGFSDATIKRYIVDGPQHYLEPLNPEYKVIKIEEDCVIIGVVKQIIQDL